MNQEEWNEFAKTYASVQQESRLPIQTDVVAALQARYPLADWTVADLAAGSGRYAKPLAAVSKHVMVSDWAKQMLAEARVWLGEAANVTYRQADWRDLPPMPIADLVFVSQLPTLTAAQLPDLAKLATHAVAINTQTKQISAATQSAADLFDWPMPQVYQADSTRAAAYQVAQPLATVQTFSYQLAQITTAVEVLQGFECPFGVQKANTLAQALGTTNAQQPFVDQVTYTYQLLTWSVTKTSI